MISKAQPQASDVVRRAAEGLIERTRSAAQRVLNDRADPEAVHDFRVGMRRLRTVLRAARLLHGKRRVAAASEALARFGDATGALRDEEVLGETVQATELPEAARSQVRAWLHARTSHEVELREAAVQLLSGPGLDDTLESMRTLMAGKPKKGEQPLDLFARRILRDAQRGVRALLPVSRDDAAGLHRLRIRFKRLRYSAEMLGGFMTRHDAAEALRASSTGRCLRSQPHYAALAKLAARMQKDLGLLHDADQALETVATARGLDAHTRAVLLEALLSLRDKLNDRALERLAQMPAELLGLAE